MRDPLTFPGLTRRDVLADLAVGCLVGLVTVPVHAGEGPAAVVVAVMVSVALACRRAAPTAMIVLALASAVIQVATDQVAVLPSLAYAVLFHTTGGHPDRRVRWSSLAVGIIGVVVAGFVLQRVIGITAAGRLGISAYLPLLIAIAAAAAVVIGGWTTGFIRYQRRTVERATVAATIAELQRRRILDLYDEQAERTRLARDMHDVVAHSLAVVVAQAEGARYALSANPHIARDALEVIAGTARGALGDVRELLTDLRAPAGSGDRRPNRQDLLERMRAAGMTIEMRETGEVDSDGSTREAVVHAVLTEALTNALKYGALDHPVRVSIEWSGGLRLTVRNAVPATARTAMGAGYGLLGMRERAALLGGAVTSGADGAEWVVDLTIPAATAGAR